MWNPASIRESGLLSTLPFLSSARTKVSTARAEIKYYPAALYFPGGTRAKWAPQPPGRKRHPVAAKRKVASDLAFSAKPAPAAGQPVAAMHEPAAGSGSDAESADPAFPVFSPHPPVADRSLLPASQQQVVVDVKVSATGEVLEATLVKGIGNALDQIVVDTVKTWRFHPAMLQGSPVPTEAELIFPFDEKYPTSPS
jgi:TonB family protein